MGKKFYLTKKGLERIKKEYEELRRVKVLKIKKETSQILGSENINPEYISFREDLGFLEAKMAELENVLKNFELVKAPPKEKQNVVYLGATVTLEGKEGQVNEFMVVGTLEADPNEGRISFCSLLGKALLGHKIGDKVTIHSSKKTVFRITEIKYKFI